MAIVTQQHTPITQDNQPTKVKEPNGTITETGDDGEGRVTKEGTDGNKHATEYIRNAVGEVTEVIDRSNARRKRNTMAAGK